MFLRSCLLQSILVGILFVYFEWNFSSNLREERRAWITLLSTDDYLPGIQALARSLKRAQTAYPLVVLMHKVDESNEVYRAVLNEGCHVRFIDDLIPTQYVDIAFPQFTNVWDKLRAFEIVDVCDRCVFMDGDIIVLKNMDELFDMEKDIEFGAVQTCSCNFRGLPKYPENWKPENCPYTYEQNSSLPKPNHSQMVITFNSGVFLYRPDLEVFKQMKEALNTWNITDFRFADQDFLNKFYENRWTRLAFEYNAVKLFMKSHPTIWDISQIKAVHFVISKPWKLEDPGNTDYESINHLWWDAYRWQEHDP